MADRGKTEAAYDVRVRGLRDVEKNIELQFTDYCFYILFLVPHAPSDAVLQLTSNSKVLLTWKSTEGPVDFYEFTISQDGVPDRIYQFEKKRKAATPLT